MKKQFLAGLVLAALPFTAMAADTTPMSETIQVVKATQDASAVTDDAITGVSNAAETKDNEATTKALSKAVSKSLAFRVSSTATPEVNRKIREEMGQITRRMTAVAVPGADAFEDRKEVGVAPANITLDHMDLTYPTITSVSPVVQKKINDSIFKYVKQLKSDLEKDNLTADDKNNLIMYYDIKTDSKGILSFLIYTYTIMDHGTSGERQVKGMTFNTTTGRSLSVGDFGGINLTEVNNLVESTPDLKAKFTSNFSGFESRPKEFYANADKSVVLISQASANHADPSKIVEIPVGVLRQEPVTTKKKK